MDCTLQTDTITWGSDYWVTEGSVGAMLAWNYLKATVLAERMDDCKLRAPDAENPARKPMYENSRRICCGGGI